MVPKVEIISNAAKLFTSLMHSIAGYFFSIIAISFAPIFHRVLHILQVELDDYDVKK